jgi:hypothetical protein
MTIKTRSTIPLHIISLPDILSYRMIILLLQNIVSNESFNVVIVSRSLVITEGKGILNSCCVSPTTISVSVSIESDCF